MSGTDPYILRAHGLGKRYGTVEAVRGLDLAVRRGEIYGFLGPNGAGKTTTLLMLLGIERPTAGRIERFGRIGPIDPFGDRRRIGVVGEQQYLYDDLSAREYLLFFGRLYGVVRPERRAGELLERLDLADFSRLRARDFSRGMQQKLGLARALLHEPELLILDEPVSGLDPHGIRQVREILVEENRRGTTVLLSSHILSEVERTAHRVGVLFGGHLVAEDDVGRISARLEPDALIELDVEQLAPDTVGRLAEEPFVRDVELASNGEVGNGHGPGRGTLRVRVAADGDHRRAVSEIVGRHGGLITSMRQERLGLEEAFVRLTSDPLTPRSPLPDVGGSEQRTSRHPTRSDVTSPASAGPSLPDMEAGDPSMVDAVAVTRERPRTDAPPFRPTASERWSARWPAISTIGRRDLLGLLYGSGIYLVVALGMLATLPVVVGHLDAVGRSRVLVLADPFMLPFFVAATLGMLYLALASVATIAREKEQGTLEVLFYGPVDVVAYVLAKHLALVLAYLPIGLGLAALILGYAGMTGLRLTGAFAWGLLLSLVAAAAVTALGVCLSTLVRGVRAGIALLGALTGLFLAIRLGSELLGEIRVMNNSSPFLFLRDLVVGLDALMGYVSPFGVFQAGADAVARGDWGAYLEASVLLCLQCALLLAVAIRLLARRGVRR